MDYRIIFGINLRQLTKEAKTNYKAVGAAVGRRGGTVQQWILGMSQPEYNILVGLAEFFTRKLGRYVSLDEFFDRKPE